MKAMKSGLFLEIVQMAADTVRTQKMRSALTILGVAIGITSMVGMTSMVRGFDESLSETIQSIGPRTIFLVQFSGLSLSSGDDFFELMQRPNLTPDDADAITRLAPSVARVGLVLGEGGASTQSTLRYQGNSTKSISVLGSTASYLEVFSIAVAMGRFFTPRGGLDQALHTKSVAEHRGPQASGPANRWLLQEAPRLALMRSTPLWAAAWGKCGVLLTDWGATGRSTVER